MSKITSTEFEKWGSQFREVLNQILFSSRFKEMELEKQENFHKFWKLLILKTRKGSLFDALFASEILSILVEDKLLPVVPDWALEIKKRVKEHLIDTGLYNPNQPWRV